MKKNPLIEKYGKEKRWVNYALLNRKGRMTKMPFSPITRRQASSTKVSDWGTYEEALAVNPKNVGIVFTPERNLLGIDIDHCLIDGKLEHDEKEKIADLLIASATYTEISPSGTGLHLYFALTGPLVLEANRHANFECYTNGRYFTVTGKEYSKKLEVRTITPAEALELLAIIGYPWGKAAVPIDQPDIHSISENIQRSQANEALAKNVRDQETIVKKMLRSKGGDKIKALMDGDTSPYKNDGSAADMALLSHLAFWTQKNASQMEEIWMQSELGKREKTQTRKDYRDRSINAAIKNCKEVYITQVEKIEKENPELDLLFILSREKEKIFVQNTENMCRILRRHKNFESKLRLDTFKNTMQISKRDVWRPLKDIDIVDIQTEISILFPVFGKVGKEMIRDAVEKVSEEQSFDSAVQYLESVKWDGKKRLDSWLEKTYNVPDNEYYRAVASNWMKGLVKRLVHPGCKFDYVLVLEGKQGIKKSTSLFVLGCDWHVETTMSTDNKDFFMQFEGKAIIEFSEGETLSRTEVKKMKAIITTQVDKYRPAYGRLSVDHPRRCVFAMTTNQEEYLKDETGNRRWLPVACVGDADVKWLEENRDQLFAEAYQRVIVDKETIYEFPEEETMRMQSARRIADPNTDLVADWWINKLKDSDREAGVTIHQAYRDAICGGMTSKPIDRFMEMNLADIFRTGLKLEKRRKMYNGVQGNRWYPTDESLKTEDGFKSPVQPAFGAFGE